MSINLGNSAVSHNAAQQAALAEQIANQEETTKNSETVESAQENGTETTVTKDAVQGKNSDSQGQGGSDQQSSHQGSSETQETKSTQGNTSTSTQKGASVQPEKPLNNIATTKTDIDGAHSVVTNKVQKEGEALVIDFSQPTLPPPTRFTTAELVIAMIKLGADSVGRSMEAQQNSIESSQIQRLQDLQIKADMMQDFYKNSAPTKSGFKMIFEGIAAFFKGNMQESAELLKRGFEASGAQIASIVMTVISVALAVASFGGASALVVLSCAALVTSLLSDPALMKDIVDLCTNGGSSDMKGFLKDFTKAMQGITMALQVITMVVTLGTAAGAVVGKIASKIASKAAKSAAKNVTKGSSFSSGATKTADLAEKMNKYLNKSLGNQKKNDAKISTFNKVATTAAETTNTGIGITTGITTAVNTSKTAEHQFLQAEVERFNLFVDTHKTESEKQDAITEQIMDRYRAMFETLTQSIATLNSAMVSASKA